MSMINRPLSESEQEMLAEELNLAAADLRQEIEDEVREDLEFEVGKLIDDRFDGMWHARMAAEIQLFLHKLAADES